MSVEWLSVQLMVGVVIAGGTISVATLPGEAQEKLLDRDQPATTVKEWMAQVEAATVQVTAVKLERTEAGLNIVLETAEDKPLQVDATKFRSEGTSLIADIPNAALALPDGQTYVAENPAADIATVQVVQQGSQIRINVAGKETLPQTQVTLKVGNSAYSLNPESDEPDEEVVVTGERQQGYRVPNASTATRTDTPIRDIPQSIQVVPQQVLQDRKPTNLVDALRSVPGISQAQQGSNSIYENPIIRGFSANTDVLRDGVRSPYATINRFDSATVERVEVLRGPASLLYGQGSLGGLINIITKQPLSEPYYSVEATAGSFGLYGGGVDFSGPLNGDKTLLYRFNFAANTRNSFVDNLFRRDFTIAPTLLWKISDRTDLRLVFEHVNITGANGQMGLPARGTILPNPNGKIPRSRDLNEPSLNREETKLFRTGYDLEHRFSNNLKLRSIFTADWFEQARSFAFPVSLAADNRTLLRRATRASNAPIYALNLNVDNYLVSNFSTGSIKHQLLVGFNYARSTQDYAEKLGSRVNISPIDIFNPTYGGPIGTAFAPPFSGEFASNLYGFYVQDQIALLDNLKLVLGGRFDIADQRIVTNNPSRSTANQNVFTPRVGLVYQPIPAISLYASYGTSFRPEANVFAITTLPEPERGKLYEVGIKADFSDQISAALALYDQTRSNILTADPNDPLQSIQVGEQNSRGIELNLVGEILPGWDVIAGYAYTDARITKDNRFPVGNRVNAVPENSFNLWTTYRFREGTLKGLGFGVGLFYQGERQGDLGNTFQLPSYLRTDAAIFYERDRFRAGLNFRNLFNIEYYEAAFNINRVFPGAPFEVQGTVAWKF